MNSNQIIYRSNIKKNLIDLLMFSLYADAKTIYREYVQNALDSIIEAVKLGILKEEKDGFVSINIDKLSKTVTIRDNGTGISSSMAISRLLDISASQKDGITAAGQFGIGRLVGGGYCHELVFRTSAKGEDIATVVTFDVDHIWKMVKEDASDYLATEVIDSCTSKYQIQEEKDLHYFEVTLRSVKAELAPSLLDETSVVSYLNMVAPVSYSSPFKNIVMYHSLQKFPEFKSLHEGLEKIQIFVGSHKIEKKYGLNIFGTHDSIEGLEYFKILSSDFGLLAWGWFALTKYSIQIPKDDSLSCIRLRKHNIQIGDFNLLSGKPLWSEERGNSYFYGELFIVHKNIVPNAARDGLAPTPEKEALYEELQEYFKNLKTLYTRANQAKKAIEKIGIGIEEIRKSKDINNRLAKDKINNQGKALFEKLLKNAQFPPIRRMLDLYKPDFNNACRKVDEIMNEFIESANLNNNKNNDSITSHNQNIDSSSLGNLPKVAQQHVDYVSRQEDRTKINGDFVGYNKNKPQDITSPFSVPETTDENQRKESNALIYRKLGSDSLEELQDYLDKDEICLLRRIFNSLNKYCPNNDHDIKLITSLKDAIISDLKQND